MKGTLLLLTALFSTAHAELVITEAMADSAYASGTTNGDWWELTNTGGGQVELGGYTWDDAKPIPSTFPAFTIQAGESIVILAEDRANVTAWKTTWRR